jgi:hypothetical protein
MRYFNLLLALLAAISGPYMTWRTWQPNLTGHWDIVEEQLDDYYSAHDWVEALDITSDNLVYLNYDYDPENIYPADGKVNRLFRSMYIGPSCLSLDVKYHPDGNTLYLELPNYENPSEPYRLTAVKRYKCHHGWKPNY